MIFRFKKGFLQIDFAFVVLIFFLLFFLSYTLYNSEYYKKVDDFNILKIGSDANDLCNLLISNPGYPIDWQSNMSTADFFGLKSDSGEFLDSSKLQVFNSTNYFDIIDVLSVSDFVKIKITGLDSKTKYLDFGVEGGDGSLVSYSKCFSNYNSEIVAVEVLVWN